MSSVEEQAPISVFYSYSHKDEDLRLKLEDHLASLRWSGMISEWHDRDIDVGEEWEKEIDRHLSSADIILLLVSASFIASRYCWSVEVKKALERHDRGEAKVIPVILRSCRWTATPFAKLQAAPKNAKPVSLWADQDEAFDDVVTKIERVVAELRQKRAAAETPVSIAPAPLASPPSPSHPDPLPRAGEGDLAAPGIPRPPAGEGGARRASDGRVRAKERPVPKDGIYIGVDPRAPPDFAVFRDVDAPWCPEMVVIPAGQFLMGSPDDELRFFGIPQLPQHKVIIGRRFTIGRCPATVGEYRHFAEATGRHYEGGMYVWAGSDWKADAAKSWRDPGFAQTDRHPVVGVSRRDAQAYVQWLAEATGKAYRLPSEAEWEYACRAGTETSFSFGETIAAGQVNCKPSLEPRDEY